MNEKWFLMSVEQIEKKLKTNAASGLSPKAARSRANAHKKDAPFFTVRKRRVDRLLLDIFSDIFLVLLVLLSVFSLFFEGDVIIGSAILAVVAVNAVVSFLIYFRDKRSLESMSDFFSPTARVIRDGKLYVADYRDLAEGDVILVEKGDILGCDARLVHSDSLSVLMKVDKKNEKKLDKYAGGVVREDEIYAENMVNMLHAGSTVLCGSGRAIVTALGKYTYLGAMTGGISEVPSQTLPEGLTHLKKAFSRLGMILLLLTLPFCTFAVIFGSFEGGNALLSEAVLLALSVGSCAMLSRFSNLLCTFFVRFMRRSAVSDDPCIVRSLEAFDGLADLDCLFLLDGSIATDGILHFEKTVTADGEAQSFERVGQTSAFLSELAAIYHRARSSAPSVGVKPRGELDVGIREVLSLSKIDMEALKIRYNILSYLPGIDRDSTEVISYTDRSGKAELFISCSKNLISECSSAMLAGVSKPLGANGRSALLHAFDTYASMGRRLIVFTRKSGEERCFVGMIVLREGSDPSLAEAVSTLRKNGVFILSFSNCEGRENSPEIPDLLRRRNRVYKSDLARNNLPVSYGFGSYDEYCGFGEADIAELAKHAKSLGKKLAVCGFSDYASEAIGYSDLFISCAPIRSGVFGRFAEEIRSLEVPGEQSSASCTQVVKAEADILLMRPKNSKGGLGPLAKAIGYCRCAYRNLSSFIKYFIFAQILRTVGIALPIAFGQTCADARHMLLLGLIMDLFAVFIFASDKRGRMHSSALLQAKEDVRTFSFTRAVKRDMPLAIATLLSALISIFLPHLIDLFGIFGNYVYKAEYSFCSILLAQLCLFVCVYSNGVFRTDEIKKLFRNKIFIAELVSAAVFVLLAFLTPFGRLFGLVSNPPMYVITSVIPAAALLVCYLILKFSGANKQRSENEKNKAKNERKPQQ